MNREEIRAKLNVLLEAQYEGHDDQGFAVDLPVVSPDARAICYAILYMATPGERQRPTLPDGVEAHEPPHSHKDRD